MQIKWLDLAAHDLEKIEQYIARDNPDAALRVVLQIVESVGQLADHPMMGRAGRVRGTRADYYRDTLSRSVSSEKQ